MFWNRFRKGGGGGGGVEGDGDNGECRRSGELSRECDVQHGGRQPLDVEVTIWNGSADVEASIWDGSVDVEVII